MNVQGLIESGALFVSNHSGGKDSQAMLIRLLEIIPRAQLLVVHAHLADKDFGTVEWEGALELARDQAIHAGLPFVVARASKKTFTEMVEHRYATRPNIPSFPSAQHRQCTSDLKRGPIQREVRRYAKANGFNIIVNCLGLRAEESASRRKRMAFRRNEGDSNSVMTWYEWLPVQGLSVAEVFGTIARAGQEPHWAYAAGNERLSCVFCIMGSKNDLRNGAKHRPDLLAKYSEIEQRTGYTMHQSRTPLADLVRPVAVAIAVRPV